MKLAIFEDETSLNFLPLTSLRPVFALRVGCFALHEKIAHAYGVRPSFHCRPLLAATIRERLHTSDVNANEGGLTLFLNGRVLADSKLPKRIAQKGPDTVFLRDNTIVAVRLEDGSRVRFTREGFLDRRSVEGISTQNVDVALCTYPWDLVNKNNDALTSDLSWYPHRGQREGSIHDRTTLVNEEEISIRTGASVGAGVVLDASEGPIVIEEGVRILPHATVIGPVFVGEHSIVKVGAKIYGPVSIGPTCKVGGEIEGTIIHGFSNKQHEGFLGHAYVGEWCNLGADTNNSDLKNNYSTVDVVVNGENVDTGEMFVGLFLGDHAKSGINTMFNTGTVVGVASNVFGAGYLPKYIPPFTWFDAAKGPQTYRLEKALEVAKRVMARRKVTMTEADAELLRSTFRLTMRERQSFPS